MSKIDGYSIYQNQYYENKVKKQKEETEKAKKKENVEKQDKVKENQIELSDAAKELLEELKKKYGNMDFFVADFSTDEEAQSYLSRGTKEYSVLLDPDTLEAMAADEATKEKYVSIIDEATGKFAQAKEQLGEEGENVSRIGFTVASDGSITYFAELEKSSAKQREMMEEAREEKKAEEKAEAKKAEKEKQEERLAEKVKEENPWKNEEIKRVMVKANSMEELVSKIKEVDWDAVASVEKPVTGGKFDFSI